MRGLLDMLEELENEIEKEKPGDKALLTALADTMALYDLSLLAHWNAGGKTFTNDHADFKTAYTQLSVAADTLAEVIRARGLFIPDLTRFVTIAGAGFHNLRGADIRATWVKRAEDHKNSMVSLRGSIVNRDHAADQVILDQILAMEKLIWLLGEPTK